MTIEGEIENLNPRGFGFIAAQDGLEYYFHANAVMGRRFNELENGQAVLFRVGEYSTGKQPSAYDVRALG